MMETIKRSMNDQLREGATDGSVKKPDGPDRITDGYTDITARDALNHTVNGFGIDPAPQWVKNDYLSGVVRGL